MATALRRFSGLSALLSAALRGIVAAALTGGTLSTLFPACGTAGLAALSAIRRRWRTAILTALWQRWHQFIPRQFAVAVLVETFERSTGVFNFGSINDAVVIRVERGNDWRNGRTRTRSIFSTLPPSPGWFVGVLSLCGMTPRNSTESQCQECDSACLFFFHVLFF